MKKLAVIGILGGLGLFGYALYNYFQKQIELVKEFQWSIVSFNITQLTADLIKGTLTVRFQNTSAIEITITQFYLDLYFNEHKVGYIQDVMPFVIPANGYNDIPFEFDLDPQFIITNISDIVLYATKQKDALIGLAGYINVNSGGFIKATVPVKCNCSIANLSCDCA